MIEELVHVKGLQCTAELEGTGAGQGGWTGWARRVTARGWAPEPPWRLLQGLLEATFPKSDTLATGQSIQLSHGPLQVLLV